MIYETSYASGRKPFRPDLERGNWQQPTDFIYACLGLMLKLDAHIIISDLGFDLTLIIMFIVCMIAYTVPMMVVHCFMGQFSSSGFISALRMSPLFKGIGYVGLALGLYFLMYFSIIAALPMIFLINSFRPTLPWSCEGWPNWATNLTESERFNICNLTSENDISIALNETGFVLLHIPSVLYFRQHFENTDFESMHVGEHEFSWVMIAVIFLVWAIIAYVFYEHAETAKFGRLLRYTLWLTLALALISFLALLQLPSGLFKEDKLRTHSFNFSVFQLNYAFAIVVMCTMRSFGSGWGSLIALSSFNNFKVDIMRYSWLISVGQMLILFFASLINALTYSHFEQLITQENVFVNVDRDWNLFVSSASAIASLKWANLWSIIYYSMMVLSALIVMSTQLFTILKSLFDEFEALRSHKQEVTFGLIGILALTSVYFTSNHAIENYMVYNLDAFVVQLILHVLLVFAALWVYGRERLQRDMEFMLSVSLTTWKVNFVRYLGFIVLVLTLLGLLESSYFEHKYFASYMHIMSLFFVVLPFLLIPGYGIYHAYKTTGSYSMHLKDACKPLDWYPVDANERRRYEELLGPNEFTQQLCDDAPEDAV